MGKWKFTAAHLILTKLFDLDADPDEFDQPWRGTALSGDSADPVAKADARWESWLPLTLMLAQSQARRWIVYEALRKCGYYPWTTSRCAKASRAIHAQPQ